MAALLWLALAVLGQAAALRLVEAGPAVRYQHYAPLTRLAEEHPAALSLVALQAALVAWGLRERWQPLRDWLSRALSPWQLAIVLAVFAVPSATVSPDVRRYLAEVAFAAFVQAVSLGNVVLAVWALSPARREAMGGRLRALLEGDSAWGKRLPFLAAAWVTSASALLCAVVYERHPHLQDEVAYLFHARYFAEGLLRLPAPPVPPAFEFYLMQLDGSHWYSANMPGWPALLAAGVLLGVPWLVNPVLAGLSVILASALARDLYDQATARAVALVLAVSPWHVFLGMSFMTHTATLACALTAAVAVSRARATRGTASALWGGLAGAALGAGVLVRPVDGVVAAALAGLWAIAGHRRLRAAALAALVLASIAVGGLMLLYNRHLTGHATVLPMNLYTDQRFHKNANAFGFGPDRGMGWAIDPWPGHGPLDALVNANLNTFMLNIELLGWSTGSLLAVALLPFLGRLAREDLAVAGVIGAVFAVYFFYYFSGGPDFGARYWSLMLPPLAILTVRGLRSLDAALPGEAGASLAAACLSLAALAVFFPWRAIDKYHGYLGMRPDVMRLLVDDRMKDDLVLVRGNAFPDYASAAVYNPLDLRRGGPVFAWDRDEEVRANVLASYADRRVWIVAGPSLTGRGFEVLRGPVPARELLAER